MTAPKVKATENNEKPELRTKIDQFLTGLISRFYREVPFASHMLTSDKLNMDYYRRHNVETVLRIRLKRVVDALAIRYFTKHDPVRAKIWAHYMDEEMLHDRLFVRDLKTVGMTEAEIYGHGPLLATKLLMGYLLYVQEYEETPLALIASVYFVEYVTTRTQPQWLDNLERLLGKDKIQGARQHCSIDVDDKHEDLVWSVLVSLMKTPADEDKAIEHMMNVYKLYVAYFTELYHISVQGQPASSIALNTEEALIV